MARTRNLISETSRSIPNDILLEIFTRLPTRSLVRFSCVAKSWNSLVYSHELAEKHLQYPNNSQHRIMLVSDGGRKLDHFSLQSALNKPSVPVYDTNHVDKFPIGNRFVYSSPDGQLVESHPFNTLIGSCNGLICIAVGTEPCVTGNDTIYVWNPSIQKSKKIPSFGEERGYSLVRSYGFGFDESRNDYKVVAFYFSSEDQYDVLVKIYSLKTGEVKRIKNHTGCWLANHGDRCYSHTTFANGKIHWFATLIPEQSNYYWHWKEYCCIAYLDLATEEYGQIWKPDIVEFTEGGNSMMALPGGSLYVYCSNSCYSSDSNTIAWFVDKYLMEPGIYADTWEAIVVSIPMYSQMNFGHRNPLFVFDNGVTLWLCDGKVIIFNPHDLSVRPSQLSCPRLPTTGIPYVESLVSPLMACDDASE